MSMACAGGRCKGLQAEPLFLRKHSLGKSLLQIQATSSARGLGSLRILKWTPVTGFEIWILEVLPLPCHRLR